MYVYSVDVKKLVINNKDTDLKAFAKKTANNNITYNEKVIYEFPYGRINNYEGAGIKEEDRPVIIGFGPAGMFAALKLSEAGLMLLYMSVGTALKKDTERLMNSGIQESLIHSQMCSSVKAEQEHFQTESLIQ